MDKYEYRIKAEQIVKLVGRRKYTEAVKIADEIDWNRVKNVQMLCTVSDVYEKNEKYEEAREILFLAYDRSPADRMIVYKIVELSLALGDLKEAVNYFREYSQLAPNDTNIYILKYKLYVANNANIETLISVLEEFKEQDFHEEWAYELARLYAEGGYIDKCVELCDELDLWFSEGPYVMQALELKQQFEVLTEAQQKKLDRSYEAMNEAADLEKIISDVQPEEESRDIPEEEEDMFFAGKTNIPEDEPQQNEEELNVGYEDEVPKAADELEDGLAQLEYYPDDDAEFGEEEETRKERGHSESVFSRLGRLGKMLVEPASDYDLESEEEEDALLSGEDLSEEDMPEEENPEEQIPNVSQEKEIIEKKVKGKSKFSNSGKFDLSELAAVQEAYEESREKYEENVSQQEDSQIEEREQSVEEAADDMPKQDAETVSDIAEKQTDDKPEENLKKGDTKRFERLTIRKKIDKAQYEKNIEGALKKLDKVVKGEMPHEEFREEMQASKLEDDNDDVEITVIKDEQVSDKEEKTQDVWNGVSRYDTMNLQKELAKSIQKLLEATEMNDVDSTLEDVKKLVEDSNIPELTETMRFRTVKSTMLNNWAKNQADKLKEVPEIEETIEHNCKSGNVKERSVHKRKYPAKKADVEVIPSIKLKPTKEERKRKLEQILVQEDDGQIGLIMPKEEMVEKQITGQLNIEDILQEWNRQKNDEENEREKMALEEARNKALNETQEFMSQVMDLLSQCIPRCGDDDSRSLALTVQLNKVRQALNSTHDLSEISKLNIELAEILEKICPISEKKEKSVTDADTVENDSPAVTEAAASETLIPEEVSENVTEENVETEADAEAAEEEAAEDIAEETKEEEEAEESADAEPENTDAEAAEEEVAEDIAEAEEEEVFADVTEEAAEDDADDKEDDISRLMNETLQELAMEVQESAAEKDMDISDENEEGEFFEGDESMEEAPEDDDVADDIENDIEEGLPESAEAISESEEEVDLFDSEENTFVEGESGESILPDTGVASILSDENVAESGLTQKQKDVFSYFASFENVAEQINRILNVDRNGNKNIVITGADGTGKTSLAIRIAKAQELEGRSHANKVAKIKASSLNNYDLEEVFKTVEDGILIIEKAVALSDGTMSRLNEKLNKGANVQIILTTKKKSVDRLRARNAEFMDRFEVFIDMPSYNNNELVEYGKTYARANGYEIEDMAVLALFSRLGNLQSTRGTLSFDDVKEIIDNAVENADRRNNKFFKKLFGKKGDNSSYLQEDDFE